MARAVLTPAFGKFERFLSGSRDRARKQFFLSLGFLLHDRMRIMSIFVPEIGPTPPSVSSPSSTSPGAQHPFSFIPETFSDAPQQIEHGPDGTTAMGLRRSPNLDLQQHHHHGQDDNRRLYKRWTTSRRDMVRSIAYHSFHIGDKQEAPSAEQAGRETRETSTASPVSTRLFLLDHALKFVRPSISAPPMLSCARTRMHYERITLLRLPSELS
jgi:hypothetical protein